jgi:hypothetical protein
MKTIVAGLMTTAILAAVIVFGVPRSEVRKTTSALSSAADEPVPSLPYMSETSSFHPAEHVVRQLLDAGEAGDVMAYLAAFADPLRTRIERDVQTRGRDVFAHNLKRAAAARKSHAVFAAEPEGDDSARVVVETVYPDRNERQTYRVEHTAEGWRIGDVTTARSHSPSARFGAIATYVAPEGVPVQALTPEGLTVETGDAPGAP